MTNVYKNEEGRLQQHLYWGCNLPVALVAIQGGKGDDWAVYIGGCQPSWREREAVEQVRKHGTKIPESLARSIFTDELWKQKSYRR